MVGELVQGPEATERGVIAQGIFLGEAADGLQVISFAIAHGHSLCHYGNPFAV